MTDEKRKLEPPLHLDMPFAEALERFARTDPAEVEPPKGRKPKIAKASQRLTSLGVSLRKPGPNSDDKAHEGRKNPDGSK